MTQLESNHYNPDYQYQHIEVKPVTGRIGAEISGIQLSGNLDKSVVDEFRVC